MAKKYIQTLHIHVIFARHHPITYEQYLDYEEGS